MTEIDPVGNPEYAYVQAADAIAARVEAGEITHMGASIGQQIGRCDD
jgi:hypothetical protein